MTIDSSTYDNGNNMDKCGMPLSVSDRSEFAVMALLCDTITGKHYQMNRGVNM